MTFYFIARDRPMNIISTATDSQQMVGEYLMFFKNNTHSKFAIAKN